MWAYRSPYRAPGPYRIPLGDQGSVKVLPGAASRGTWRESVRALPEGAGSTAAKSVVGW